jgi:fluoride exporter
MSALSFLWVFLGAGLGGVLRYGVNIIFAPVASFPWSTLFVNAAGGFAMGALSAWLMMRNTPEADTMLRLFLATGVLGGFTTFSAFSLDAVVLWQRGETGIAILYVLASVILSILALIAGMMCIKGLN